MDRFERMTMHTLQAHIRSLLQRGRAFDLQALRLFLRIVPNEQQRVFALTIVLGVLCGLAAVAFDLSIRAAEGFLINRALAAPGASWIGWTLLLPTLGGLVSGAILYYVVPDARGSGIPQVKVAYAVKGGRMPFRVALGKFALGVIQIGSGASLGREGPTVQICAGIASLLGRVAALSRQSQQRLLPVGAAAGIAAAFNAPIAAVTFTIEEIVGDLDQTVLAGIIVAAAVAAAIERTVLGTHPVFSITQSYQLDHAESLLLYALLGVVAAIVSVIFTEGLLNLRAWFQRLTLVPTWARPGIGGFVTGSLIVAAMLWLGTGGINGGGYDTLTTALDGRLAVKVLIALCAMKLAATVFSYSSGGAGGLFAPSLFVGGMLGGAVGWLDVELFHHATSEVGAFALVGMGAVFAGVVRAPITSVLIIFELTGGYGLILPLMLANMTAYALARRWRPLPIYEALLEQDGVHLPHGKRAPSALLEQLQVGSAMTTNPVTLSANLDVSAALEYTASGRFSSFPVLDTAGRFVGLVSEARLRRTLAENSEEQPIALLVDRQTPLFPDQRLLEAIVAMGEAHTRHLAVVERARPYHLIGLLSLSDIVRVQAEAVRTQANGEAAEPPALSEVQEMLTDQPAFQLLQPFSSANRTDVTAPSLRYHQVVLQPDDPATGNAVRTLKLPPGVLLVTLDRGEETLIPRGETVLAAGDTVTLFANPNQLPAALEALTGLQRV